jgi:predicted transcriptional regulator
MTSLKKINEIQPFGVSLALTAMCFNQKNPTPLEVLETFEFFLKYEKNLFNKNQHVLTPAVPIDESVTDDYIICLEDGKRLQVLKRYLKNTYNLSLREYKERWELPESYPTVAKNYSIRRSNLAKTFLLGKSKIRRNSKQ